MSDIQNIQVGGTSYSIKAPTVVDRGEGTTGALKFWTGTREEYDSLVTAGTVATDTLYNITDDAGEQPDVFPDQTGQAGKYLTTDGSDVSWGNAVDYKNLTNCILDIPQDIKLELNANRALVLKAGSKVYIPNGFESDGTTPKFDVVTIDTDIQQGNGHAQQDMYFYRNISSSRYITGLPIENCYSGATAPTEYNYMFWYDTANNLVKYYNNGTWITNYEYSLPICITTGDSATTITSIDQVFNGFGYVGLTYFALPNIKFLVPDGRNADGTLKNTEATTTKVSFVSLGQGNDAYSLLLVLNSSTISLTGRYINQETNPITTNTLWYRPSHNRNYISGSTPEFYRSTYISIGYVDRISNKLTNFRSKLPIRLVDYGDKAEVAQWSFPSGTYKDYTLGASGATYQMPADGWIYVRLNNITLLQLYSYLSGSETMASFDHSSTASYLASSLPVKKGMVASLSYSGGTPNNIILRFFYAEGEVPTS